MIVTQILFLPLLVILSTCYTSESRSLEEIPFIKQNDNQNCFCFDTSGKAAPTVPNIMHPSNGLERLVVYLYKDLASNLIKMYIPDEEKQKLIPDLPIENDGLIQVSADAVSTILSRSPHKLLIQENNEVPGESLQISRDDLAPTNDILSPEVNEAEFKDTDSPAPEINIELDSYSLPSLKLENDYLSVDNLPQNKIIDFKLVNQTDKPEYKDEITNYPEINIPQVDPFEDEQREYEQKANEEKDIGNKVKDKTYSGLQMDGLKQLPISYAHKIQEKPLVQNFQNLYPKINNPYIVPSDYSMPKQEIPENFPMYTQLNRPHGQTIQKQPYSGGIPAYTIHELDQWIHEQLANTYVNDMVNQPTPSYNIPKVDNILLEQLKGYNKPKNEDNNMDFMDLQQLINFPNYLKNNLPYEVPSLAKIHFREWIIDQSQFLKDLQSGLQEKIDLSTIAKSIIHILYKNGMYITNDGMLVDSHGNVLDLHNLNLIPILIGSNVPLGNLLNRHGLFSSQMPYTQAIIVSITNPSKILGLIPLGNTYYPLPVQNTLTNTWKSKPQSVVNKEILQPDLLKKLSYSEISNPIVDLDDLHEVNIAPLDDNKREHYIPIPSKRKPSKTHKSKTHKHHGHENHLARVAFGNNLSVTSSRRGYKPGNLRMSEPHSKTFNAFNTDSLTPVESHSSIDRLFLPHLRLVKEPLLISSARSNKIPLYIDVERDPIWQIPDLMPNYFDASFRSTDLPENYVVNNEGAKPTELGYKSHPMTVIVEKNSDPVATLKKLSLMDLQTMKSKIPIHSIERQPGLKSRINLPGLNLDLDKNSYFSNFNLYKKPPVFHELPITYKQQVDLKDLEALPIPSRISPGQYPDISSRSGTLPIWTAQENTPNSEHLGLLLDGEDDDDSDGDFRIIGGNAATGSGTPLSNKGRSGNNF